MSAEQYIWNVSIIVQYDDSDPVVKGAYDELEESILIQNRNDCINYFIFFYNRNGDSYIKKLRYGIYGAPKLSIEKNLGRIDFFNGTDLVAFLNDYVKPQVRGNHTRNLLITWGHGAGYGFFAEENAGQQFEKKLNFSPLTGADVTEEIRFLKSQFSIEGIDPAFVTDTLNKRGFTTESTNVIAERVKVISTVQLKTIIGQSIGKVDVLLCLNCYMQTFESGYILRDVVDMVIAPQVMISFYGYNYKKLFELLHIKPACELEEIATNLTSYYLVKFEEEPLKSIVRDLRAKKKIMDIREVAFSAIQLKDYDQLFALLNEIAGYLLDHMSDRTLIDRCKKARKKCLSVKGNFVIDFRHFFVEFCRYYAEEQISVYEDDLQEFQARLFNFRKRNMVSILQPGILLEADLSEQLLPSIGAQFFSIFFPFGYDRGQFDIRKLLFGYKKVIENSVWVEFLEKTNDRFQD